ncbi:hypothetical protein ACSTLK_23665, partial [Vibrio parahaemolyticus]
MRLVPPALLALATALGTTLVPALAQAQSTPQVDPAADAIIVTGTREEGRRALQSATPISVVG